MSLRGVLSRVFGRGAPEPSTGAPSEAEAVYGAGPIKSPGREVAPRKPRRRPPRWTPEEDAKILAVEIVPVASRTKLAGESPLQRLARELGRTERAVISRRQRLTDKRAAAELERKAAERAERDRAIVATLRAGASLKEAGRRFGISPQAVTRIAHRDAPDLNLDAKGRGFERRELRRRIARDMAPRVLDAALSGEGFTLSRSEVAGLVSGIKRGLRRERKALSEGA